MNLKEDWKKVKSVLEQGQASSIDCSIGTVNPDGTPHIIPVGTDALDGFHASQGY